MKNTLGMAIMLFLACLAHGQTQTNLLVTVVNTADSTKIVSWNSTPGATYTLESTETLDPPGLAQARWVTREVEYPSQGTNTVWMDVGDPTWIPRLHHPRLGLSRFYRVIQTGTNALASPSVSVSLYTNNAVMPPGGSAAGFLEVRFSVDGGTNADIVSEILVFVDGQIVKRRSSASTNAWVNTTEWGNTQHTIWVAAKTVEAADTTTDDTNWNATITGVGISTPQTVTFDNFIYNFFVASPFYIPSVDGVQEIVADFQEESYWRLWVLQGGQNVVTYFEGTNTSLYVAWDGKDYWGDEVYDGFYDYLIEARPTRIGPFLSGVSAMNSMASVPGAQPTEASLQKQAGWLTAWGETPAQSVFQRDPNFQIPAADRNPGSLAPGGTGSGGATNIPPAPLAASSETRLLAVSPVGNAAPVPLFLYPPGFDTSDLIILDPLNECDSVILSAATTSPARIARVPSKEVPPSSNGPRDDVTDTQSASTPIRIPGEMFKGFAGVYGTAYQSHHVSWKDTGFFSMPVGASGFTSTWAPYGKLRNAGTICDNFSRGMTANGWRRSFQLADESFRWADLAGCYTGNCISEYGLSTAFGGRFRQGCDLGLLVGHMVAASTTPSGAAHSYYPFWNPTYSTPLGGTMNSYSWIGLPEMDFGQSQSIMGGPSYLKWMGLYGCNSLRLADVNDMWTKFLLPMPYNMRVLLGSGSTVYIAPDFGTAFADNLNGLSEVSSGSPMTVVESWYNAGTRACAQAATTRNPLKRPGQVTLTAVYRDQSIFGDPGTLGDTIWSYPGGINLDYIDIGWGYRVVWPQD